MAAPASNSRIKFLCIDLTDLNPYTRLLTLAAGTIAFFQLNSFIEEYVFRTLPNFKFALFMTLIELLMFAVIAMLERLTARTASSTSSKAVLYEPQTPLLHHVAPLKQHLWVACWMTFARVLTNVSLQYLSYPTQVIFKSMKLLTVMLGSVVYLRQRYKLADYVSAVLLVMAAIFASFGDSKVTPAAAASDAAEVSAQTIGLIMVTVSLVFDSLHSNTQDSLVRQHGASTNEAMLFTNGFAAIGALAISIITGELLPALRYCFINPSAIWLLSMRACVVYGGVLCFVTLVKSSGAVAATAVTTIRKIITIAASYLLFPKPTGAYHVYATAAFVASVLLSGYDAVYNKPNKQPLNVKPKGTNDTVVEMELAQREKHPLIGTNEVGVQG